MSTQSKLVERLAAKTEVNELDWKPTGSENTFTVSFKLNSIVLSRIPGPNSATYRVEIIDANGNIVETFSDGELDTAEFATIDGPYFQMMSEMFERARRRAYGADKIIDDILKALE